MFMFLIFCVVAVVSIGVWTGLNALVAGQCKAAEIVKGACSGLVQVGVIFFATSAHPWIALMALIMVAALAVFYVCWSFQISTYGIRRIVGIFAIFAILLTTFWATIEAIRAAVGPATIIGSVILLFGRIATIVVVGLIVARILSTFGRSVLVKVVVAIAAVLVVAAVVFAVYEGVSALDFHSFKVEKAAVSAVDESEGNFILRWLKGLSNDETEVVEVEVDDESVAAEVAEESVAAEVEAEADAKAETDDEAEVVKVKWGTYEKAIKDHPEFTIYNFPLTTDDDPDNNSYFGPNIYDPNKTATEYWKTIKEMMEDDPFILSEAIATADEARHTDLCGAYYNGDDAEWAEAINLMIEDFFNQPGNFVNLSERFIDLLNNETRELQLVHLDNIQDQYFLDIYTRKGIPRLVVCETHQFGDVLIAWVRTKGGPENDVGLGFRLQCCNVCAVFRRDGTVTPISEEMNIPTEEVPEMPKGYDPPTPTPKPTATPTPEPTATPTPVPGGGSDPTPGPTKAPNQDPVNRGEASKGGGDNSGGGSSSGEEQKSDPRQETKPVSETPQKKPETPPPVEQHKQEQESVVDHENKMDYTSDPVTKSGAADGVTPPTETEGGDGEFSDPDA